MSGDCDTVGRAAIGDQPDRPPPPSPGLVYSGEDLLWSVYGLADWLAHTWAPDTEERLDALTGIIDDLAEAVHHLSVLVVVALATTIAVIGVLIAVVLLTV